MLFFNYNNNINSINQTANLSPQVVLNPLSVSLLLILFTNGFIAKIYKAADKSQPCSTPLLYALHQMNG